MLNALKLMYHRTMEDLGAGVLEGLLDESKTNADFLRNVDGLNFICGKLIGHTEAILELTSRASPEYSKTEKKLRCLREMYDKIQLYGEVRNLASRL